MISVHPARWCTSPLGVVPAGLGDGVGHCLDVAILPKVGLFISLVFSFGGRIFTLFLEYGFFYTAGYASSYVGAHPMLQ